MTLAELIKQQSLTGTYPAIAAALNAPSTVDNPVTEPGQVPAPITLEMIMSQVPSAERVKARREPGLIEEVRIALDTGNRNALAVILEDAVTAQALSPATAAKLAPMLTATVADPAWTPTVNGPSLAQAAGFGVVTAADVQAALHGG